MSLLLIRKYLSSIFSIPLLVIIITLYFATIHATRFEVRNQCHFTVWAASRPGGGKQLLPGQTWSFEVNTGTFPAQIWGRTRCSFNEAGRGKYLTGDCGGHLKCQDLGQPPYTMAEYHPQLFDMDFLDISLVDGFNLPMEFSPTKAPFGSWERRLGNGNSIAFPRLVNPGMGNGFLAHGKVWGKVNPSS